LALNAPARAASPEDDYIAARDAAIGRIKTLEAKKADEAAVDEAQTTALADLGRRLQEIIGDLDVAGYPKKGVVNLEALSPGDVGFEMLDALRLRQGDFGPQIVVTTDGLLDRWLRAPAGWWKKERKTPPVAEAALRDEGFYTPAVSSDSAFTKTADIPISKPAGASFAVALLGGWAQDIGPNPNQEIVVALRKDGKTFIATGNAEKIPPIPACAAIWNKIDDARTKGKTTPEQTTPEQDDKVDARYRACIGREAPKQAFFAGLIKKAQAIADGLAAAGSAREKPAGAK
jgi:hypothetical protein